MHPNLLPVDWTVIPTKSRPRLSNPAGYACQAYHRIRELAKRPADRQRLLDKRNQRPPPPDDQANPDEYFEILAEAVSRRNGWAQRPTTPWAGLMARSPARGEVTLRLPVFRGAQAAPERRRM